MLPLEEDERVCNRYEDTLSDEKWDLETSHKRVEDLELSLNEAQEGWKTIEDGFRDMHHENLELSKSHAKSLEDDFSLLHILFENVLQQVKLFYPIMHIS